MCRPPADLFPISRTPNTPSLVRMETFCLRSVSRSESHLRRRGSCAESDGVPDVHVERSRAADLVYRSPFLGAGAVRHQRAQSRLPVPAFEQGELLLPVPACLNVCGSKAYARRMQGFFKFGPVYLRFVRPPLSRYLSTRVFSVCFFMGAERHEECPTP